MFAPYCTGHGSRILLPLDAINAISRTAHGFRIDFTCTCGHRGRHTIHTVRSDQRPPSRTS